ncbi:Major facilitator superfamily domain containing protein [Amanita muscaria]
MSSVNDSSAEDASESETLSSNCNELHEDNDDKPKPLPWSQLSIAYLIETAENLITTVTDPFINQFVQETGITQGDEQRTGYFTGILLSVAPIAEATSVILWGMASDRVGRRPILMFGPLGLALAILAFGMSTQYWLLVIFHFSVGVFSGNIALSKTVIGEITDSTNIADAYALLPVAWTVGQIIGPFIGGFLAQSTLRWPDTFGKFEYLRKHPYFLPCFAASLVAFLAFVVAAVALKETLPSAISQQTYNNIPEVPASPTLPCNDDVPSYDFTESGARDSSLEHGHVLMKNEELEPQTVRSLLKLPEIRIILINFGFLGFCGASAWALDGLMWSMSIKSGGLGWSPYTIGMTMTVRGVATAVLQAATVAKFIRHFGARKVHVVCFSGLIVSFLSFPIASFFAQHAGGSDWRVWIIVVVSLTTQSMRLGSYASLQIILTGTAPNQTSLGTTIGLGQAVSAIMRCLGPFFASSLHSISLQYRLAGGNAVYYIMAAIVASGIPFSLMLPKH